MRPSVGLWCWDVAKCEGGDIGRIVEKAHLYRLGHVLVKTNDGSRPYNGTLGPLVRALKDAGIHVWSWAYVYPNKVREQAEAFAARSLLLGVNGLCVDAETEFKGRPDAAVAYMEALRGMVGTRPVAVSTFDLAVNHPTFPWREFFDRADYAMPQVYWQYRTRPPHIYKDNPEQNLRDSLAQYAEIAGVAKNRVIPVGAAWPEAAGPASNLRRFVAEAEAQGLGQVNFWSWQYLTPDYWEAVRAVTHGGEQ